MSSPTIMGLQTILKQIGKLNPKMGSFIAGSLSAGHLPGDIFNFIKNTFSGDEGDQPLGALRPDQRASKAQRSSEQAPGKIIKKLGLAGATLGGLGLLGRGAGALAGALQAQPQQVENQSASSQAPPSSPGSAAPAAGPPPASPGGAPQAPPQAAVPVAPQQAPSAAPAIGGSPISAAANFISQNPKLGQALDQLIAGGASPEAAATKVKLMKEFKDDVMNIEQQIGQPFPNIIAQIWGGQSKKAPKASGIAGKDQTLAQLLSEIESL